MNLSPALNTKSFAAINPSATGSTDSVSANLRPSIRGAAGRFSTVPKSQHEQLVKQTQTWVAQTFFGTLLKQMRDSPFKSELFSGGRGGEAFSGLQDQHLAEHMARGAGSKLVNGIVRRIEAAAAYKKQSKSRDARSVTREEEAASSPAAAAAAAAAAAGSRASRITRPASRI